MTHRLFRHAAVCCAMLLASACVQEDADPARPQSYDVTIGVEPGPGNRLQRLQLPAAALAGVRRQDLADIRVFDGKGAALPVALVEDGALADPEKNIRGVPAYPIVGTAGALRLSGVTLKIEGGSRARIVGAEGRLEGHGGSGATVVGALLDTRDIADPAVSLQLDMELPAAQPVVFNLEKSSDLARWQPIAEKVFFRAEGTPDVLGTPSVLLQSEPLEDQYVRVSWSTASPPSEPVQLSGARVVTSKRAASQRVRVVANAPEPVEARELHFSVPFAAGIAAIRLSGADEAAILPVTAYGRAGRDEAWHLLGAGIVRNGEANIELGDAGFNEYRISADSRTAGFASAPRLELLFEPVELLVQFSGEPPYTLAAGLASAPGAYLTLDEILPAKVSASGLPDALASVEPGDVPEIDLSAPRGDSASPRRLALWLALALGVAVLGFAIWKLVGTGNRNDARSDGAA